MVEITDHGEADFDQNKRKLFLIITNAMENSKGIAPGSGDSEVTQAAPGKSFGRHYLEGQLH